MNDYEIRYVEASGDYDVYHLMVGDREFRVRIRPKDSFGRCTITELEQKSMDI